MSLNTFDVDVLLFFATCSHSFSLAPTRHLKLHLGWFPWNAKWNPHIFLSDKMQPWIPRAKHNGSNFSHSLSLALSLLIFYMLNRVLHREQNSRIPQMPSRTGIPRLARWLSWSRKFRPGWPPGPGWCLHRSERQTSKRSVNTARTVSRRGVRVKTIASRCSWARDHQQLSKESEST